MEKTQNNNRNNKTGNNNKKKKKRVPNYPRIIAWSIPLVLIICGLIVVLRVAVWNKGKEYVMTAEDYENIKLDTKDNLILMPPSKVSPDSYDGVTDILIFGNDSYVEGCEDGTGIIDYFEKGVENVNIYNCSLPGTYLNSFNESELSPSECPEDYFTLFWLCLSINWHNFDKQYEALCYLDPNQYDLEKYQEVLTILEGIDYSKIDVVMFCYDGHDYIKGHNPINYIGEDAQTENVATLLGSLNTSVYIINQANPDTQYVYVSPAFCYATDADGNKISCAIADTGYGTIETTFNTAKMITNYYGVSYVDLYSGVLIHEDNASTYLEDDGITPNKTARELIADRLITVLKERL